MDYIVMSRKDYVEFEKEHRFRNVFLSPDSKEMWEESFNRDFSQMQKFVWQRAHALPLYKRIGLIAAFSLMIVGVSAIISFAIKCLIL